MPGRAAEKEDRSTGTWPKPSVAVDVVALTVDHRKLELLVHRRQRPPDEGQLALPGVLLVDQEESPEEAVDRALREKASLSTHGPTQLISVENRPDRNDSRGWVISVVFLTVVPWGRELVNAIEGPGVRLLEILAPPDQEGSSPTEVRTLAGEEVHLAFDHQVLISKGLASLRRGLFSSEFCLGLVGEQFTLRQLQDVYETVLAASLYRTSFRRRMAEGQVPLIQPTGLVLDSDPRKPELYRRSNR